MDLSYFCPTYKGTALYVKGVCIMNGLGKKCLLPEQRADFFTMKYN